MNCRDIETLLAEGRPLDAGAEKHLNECAGCRSLITSLDACMSSTDQGPMPETLIKLLPAMTRVKPLPPDRLLISVTMGVFVVFSLLLAAMVGLRGFHHLTLVERFVYYGVVGFFGFLFSLAAVQTAIPGARVRVGRKPVVLGSVLAGALAVTVLFHNFALEHFVAQGIPCLLFGCICTILFGAIAAIVLRKGYVTDPRAAVVFIACFGGFSGVAALSLHCPIQNAAHIIVWHLGTVAVSALAGFAIFSFFHRKV